MAARQQRLQTVNDRNLGFFSQKVEKLDAQADDLKVGFDAGDKRD
jgi:hypothetical protein